MFLLVYRRHFYMLFARNTREYDSQLLVANYFGRNFHREKMFAVNHMYPFNREMNDLWRFV